MFTSGDQSSQFEIFRKKFVEILYKEKNNSKLICKKINKDGEQRPTERVFTEETEKNFRRLKLLVLS